MKNIKVRGGKIFIKTAKLLHTCCEDVAVADNEKVFVSVGDLTTELNLKN